MTDDGSLPQRKQCCAAGPGTTALCGPSSQRAGRLTRTDTRWPRATAEPRAKRGHCALPAFSWSTINSDPAAQRLGPPPLSHIFGAAPISSNLIGDDDGARLATSPRPLHLRGVMAALHLGASSRRTRPRPSTFDGMGRGIQPWAMYSRASSTVISRSAPARAC